MEGLLLTYGLRKQLPHSVRKQKETQLAFSLPRLLNLVSWGAYPMELYCHILGGSFWRHPPRLTQRYVSVMIPSPVTLTARTITEL